MFSRLFLVYELAPVGSFMDSSCPLVPMAPDLEDAPAPEALFAAVVPL